MWYNYLCCLRDCLDIIAALSAAYRYCLIFPRCSKQRGESGSHSILGGGGTRPRLKSTRMCSWGRMAPFNCETSTGPRTASRTWQADRHPYQCSTTTIDAFSTVSLSTCSSTVQALPVSTVPDMFSTHGGRPGLPCVITMGAHAQVRIHLGWLLSIMVWCVIRVTYNSVLQRPH